MNTRAAALAVALTLPGALPAAQAAVKTTVQAAGDARVQVARETAKVRLLQRTGQLQAVRSVGCGDRPGLRRLEAWKDAAGVTRLVRYAQRYPDNTLNFTGYYDAAGVLRYAQGRASGFAGPLYNLVGEFGPRGELVREYGTRRSGQGGDLRALLGARLNGWARGQCS